MISVSYVARETAELRIGPGTQFRLKDMLLDQGDQVVLLERVGAWQKVVALESQDIGWVHHASLGKILLNTKPLTLESRLLPRVFATKALKRAYAYTKNRKLKISIPKGHAFLAFRYAGSRTLVYLATTNSVIWLEGEAVQ